MNPGMRRLRERVARREVSRIGLFSGSFNPPHLGHIQVLGRALNQGIEHLVVFCHSDNWRKRHLLVALEKRIHMLQMLVDGSPHHAQLTVWDPAYSETFRGIAGFRAVLEFLAVEADSLTVVCGEDSIRDDLPDFLASLPHLIHERPGFDRAGKVFPARSSWMSPVSTASSTDVRAMIGSSCDALPPALADYIVREKLYGPGET